MRPELKTMLSVLLVLLGLEVGTRLLETRLSKDIQHLRSLPQQAKQVRETAKDHTRVLLLGNSLARCGVHLPTLKAGLEQSLEKPVLVSAMHPDGSKIEEWAYGYNRYFRDTNSAPDMILLITGRQHLTDKIKSVEDMGAFYVGSSDLVPFIREHLHGLEDIGWFLAARYSTLMAHRERVEPLVFYKWIPRYEQTAQEINRTVQAPAIAPTSTCKTFEWFASGLRQQGVRLFIASAPLPEPFSLPDDVRQTAANHSAFTHESGEKLRLPPERFPDQYHLDETGAAIFTKDLLPSLAVELKR